MNKLIGGIIAVICLQVGFVAYMASDTSPNTARNKSAAQTSSVTTARNDLAGNPPPAENRIMIARGTSKETEFDELAVASSGNSTIEKPAPLRLVTHRKNNIELGPRVIRAFRRSPARSEPLFPTYTIAYQKPAIVDRENLANLKVAVETRSSLSSEAKKANRSVKKSFVAKTLPIIKKPYDWLKAIGSRLR